MDQLRSFFKKILRQFTNHCQILELCFPPISKSTRLFIFVRTPITNWSILVQKCLINSICDGHHRIQMNSVWLFSVTQAPFSARSPLLQRSPAPGSPPLLPADPVSFPRRRPQLCPGYSTACWVLPFQRSVAP